MQELRKSSHFFLLYVLWNTRRCKAKDMVLKESLVENKLAYIYEEVHLDLQYKLY